jgi:hypothetical protein
MKARRVRGLEPDGTLADNAQRIVAVRLDELCGFMPQAADPAEQHALHDMRIAAKRLRYVLEVTGHCFGPYADTARKRAKALQALLGEIHDCDEHLPQVEALIEELRAADVAAVRAAAADDAKDLPARAVAGAPHAAEHAGLVALATYTAARRDVLFDRFLDRWKELEREGFRARLEYAIGERPELEPFDEPDPEPEPAPAAEPEPSPAAAPEPEPAARPVAAREPEPPPRPPAPRSGLGGAAPLAPLRPAVGSRPARSVVSPVPDPPERS